MGEQPDTNKGHIDEFLEWLHGHKEDRGVMADLRQGFSKATEYRAWPHIAPWLGRGFENDRERTILLTIAAGFAVQSGIQRKKGSGENMGAVLRQIAQGGHGSSGGHGQDGLATFEARFRRFLTCGTAQEVCAHLPGMIRAAERRKPPIVIDLAQLHNDLRYWGERVKVRWAREYWGSGPKDAETPVQKGKHAPGQKEALTPPEKEVS